MCVCVCVHMCVLSVCVCRGGESHLNLKILRMVHWCLVLLTPFPPPSYNIPVEYIPCTTQHIQCIMYWAGVLNWTGICTGLVYWTGMASPVHTTHQSSNTCTTHQSSIYNTQVQCIQHTSPVHTTHQSNTWMDGSLLK